MKHLIQRVYKAIGAALGGLVGTQVDWFTTTIVGVDLPTEIDVAIAAILAYAAAYLMPANHPKMVEDPDGNV